MAAVWINEFHYDNAGTDAGEFIEIAGAAGTDVTGWSIVRYNGANGQSYASPGAIPTLSGVLTDTTGTGFGVLSFSLPQDGLQNGSPDAIALVDANGAVVEFISYEGSFTAVNGPASGLTSVDIGVAETSSTPIGASLARVGAGDDSTDFAWAVDTDDTPGGVNHGQTLTASAGQAFSIAAVDAALAEGTGGATTFSFVVTRANPSGDATVDWTLTGLGGSGQANAADFSGPTAGTVTFTGSETTKTITIQAVADAVSEPNETFSVTLANPSSGAINVATAGATILDDDIALTPIYAIQGSGQTSALVGQVVTTTGVVTAVDTNGSRGFYIQDPNGDGDAATSDGLFVFLPSGALPSVGHEVRVTGAVQEFLPSSAAVGSLSTTELASVSSVVDLGVAASPIAATVIGGPDGLLPPTESLAEGVAFYESLEGMLVTVKNAVAVGPTSSFGEIFAVVDNDSDPSNGVHATGLTDRGNLLLASGAPAFGDTNTAGGDFNPERIQIDDDSGVLSGFATPKVNVGARLGDVTGVVNYDFGNYQVVATRAYSVAAQSELVKETGSLAGDADHLLIASYNAENLDPGDGAARFGIIADQILTNLRAPDIVALQEVQDNDGPTNSTTTSADVTLQMLVDAINLRATDGIHYAFIDNPFIGDDSNGGEPGGNIRTAYLYRTDRVELVPNSLRTIAADGSAISDPAGNVDQQTNPDNPFFTSRPPLVATFTFNNEEVTVVNNHFTSKGGSAPLLGSDQPPLNAGEVQRAAQAQAVNAFVDSLLAADAHANVIVAGDLNEFPSEEPLNVLRGTATISGYDAPGSDPFFATAVYSDGGAAILSDLLGLLPADQQYDYVFEGNSETLDHVLATLGLADAAQFDVVHINAEFADQTSDHDPLLARFEIVDDAPEFTSDASFAIVENATLVGAVTAVDPEGSDVTFALDGGDDAAFFTIDVATGELSFSAAPDFETPQDKSGDNVYEIAVAATDGSGLFSTQAISIKVTDAAEPGKAIFGGNGDNSLVGTTGPDQIDGGNGDDTVDGGDGNDAINGGNGRDILVGGRGNDVLQGGNGDDSLYGGLGDDTIIGGNGADALTGGAGADVLTGGDGGDKFIFAAGFGKDRITDFAGSDQIVLDHALFANFQSVVAASVQDGANTVIALDADNTITLEHVRLASLNAGDFLFV